MMWFLVLVVVVVCIYLVYLIYLKPRRKGTDRDVSCPKSWPIVGHMASFVFRTSSFAFCSRKMYNYTHGRYLKTDQFFQSSLMLKDTELIKQLIIKDFDNFADHAVVISEELDPLFGKNLFFLKGDKWREMRSTLSPAFTGSKMRAMYVLMRDCAEQFTNHFVEKANGEEIIPVEMKDIFTRFGNDVIATCAFGITCDSLKERENEFYMIGKETANFSGVRNLIIMGYAICPRVMKFFSIRLFSKRITNFYRQLVKSNIAQRENEGIIRMDMIHLLMEARKGRLNHEDVNKVENDKDAGFATVIESEVGKQSTNNLPEWTDDDVTAQALIFFVAGFDTMSTVLCFIAYELALHPEVQKKLQKEIDDVLEENRGKITYESLVKMKYLDMVVSETMRLWPPSPVIDRVCVKPYTIQPEGTHEKPVHLKQNDGIWIPVFGIHRDPRYYPDPDRFDPERFNDENKVNIKPFTYFPFGIGPRSCIGSRFALMEAKTIVVHLLAKFDIVVTSKTQIPIKLAKGEFTVNSAHGYWLGLKLRHMKN